MANPKPQPNSSNGPDLDVSSLDKMLDCGSHSRQEEENVLKFRTIGSINSKKSAGSSKKRKAFPGARAMGMPLREAVIKHLCTVYSDEIANGSLALDMIRKDGDKRLYLALNDYRKKFEEYPFGMPTQRSKAEYRRKLPDLTCRSTV